MVNGFSDLDGEVTTTTPLPSPSLDSASAFTDDITVSWTLPDNSSDGNVAVQLSTDGGSTWSDAATITELSTTSTTLSESADGTPLLRVERNTGHKTAYSGALEVTSTNFEFTNVTSSEIAFAWRDPDGINQTGFRVERRKADSTGPYSVIADVSSTTTSYTDTSVEPATGYDYQVVAYTDTDSVVAGSGTATSGGPDEEGIVFAPSAPTARFLDYDDIYSLNPVLTHTGKSDAEVSVSADQTLDAYAQRQDRVHIQDESGGVLFTGYAITSNRDPATGRGRMRFDGIEKRLEETRPDYESLGGSLSYSQIALEKALRDYWSRTPFQNFSVTDQSTETVANDEQAQEASTASDWASAVLGSDTTPVVTSNGQLELAQTCFTVEAEDYTSADASQSTTDPSYSGGTAMQFTNTQGAALEYQFTVEHTIPESAVSIWVRQIGYSDSQEVTLSLNGDSWTVIPLGFGNQSLAWNDFAGDPYNTGESYSGGDLTPGTYTLRFEETGLTSGVGFGCDVVAPLDNRYSYTFDNDNGGSSGYLDGPQFFPDAFTVTLTEQPVSFNIPHADVTSTWNNTTGEQAIEVSNDGGQNWTPTNNSSSASVDFPDAGRIAQVRFTLDRYGSRTTATPQTGYLGQTVDDYTLTVDGNDLAVVDELELSSNHFDNIATLCSLGDFQYVVEHQAGPVSDMPVHCFQRGDETRTSPSEYNNPLGESREVAAQSYYNSIYVQGAKDESGNRPSATADDQQAIDQAGREISPGVLRDLTITTEAGALFRAQALLDKALSENDLVGTKTIGPTVVLPGFSYSVDFGTGAKEKTLEEVSLNLGPDVVEATHRFTLPYELAEEISGLRQETSEISGRV